MRILRNIILFILVFFLGYFTATTDILEGTDLGYTLDNAVYGVLRLRDTKMPKETEEIKDENEISESHSSATNLETAESVSSVSSSHASSEAALPSHADGEMDLTLLEDEIFTRVNDLRREQGLPTLQENVNLKKAARQRAIESSVSFSHTRPSGQETFTILTEEEFFYPYALAGENLGMTTAFGNEAAMAQFLFEGWVESQDHYEAMIHPEFRELGVGAYMSEGSIYAAQLFGTQKY